MRTSRLSSAFALALCLLSGVPFAAAADCHFDRTLSVSGAGALFANTGSGDIAVSAGDGTHVQIHGQVHSGYGFFGAGRQEDVQRVCDHPPIEQAGNEVRVRAIDSSSERHNVSISYTIEVPRPFRVQVTSGSGNLDLHDLGGPVNGTTGSGNIRANRLASGATLNTGSGDLEALNIAHGAQLHSGSGGIHARFVEGGDVRAEADSGNVDLSGVTAGLYAQSGSGEVTVEGRPGGSWHIGAGSGDIRLHLPPDSRLHLDATTGSGDIHASLPLTTQDSQRNELHGNIGGGGGPEVKLETGSGDIRID